MGLKRLLRACTIFAFIVSIDCYASPPTEQQVQKKARQLITSNSLYAKEHRAALISYLKQLRTHSKIISLPTLQLTFQALAQDNAYVPQTCLKTLQKSHKYFSKTPEFSNTLYTFLTNMGNLNCMKGYLYEIEATVAKHENGEHIIVFNRCFSNTTTKREFDSININTTNGALTAIEYKNINWQKILPNSRQEQRLKKQLKDQKEIVDYLNKKKIRPVNMTYQVCSKTAISKLFKQWFEQEKIEYQELPAITN